MITLKKSEQISIYQVEMTLKRKINQSPFIAILMYGYEQGEISAEMLRGHLLPALPIKACENLLSRLNSMNYLNKSHYGLTYLLTDFGKKCAEERSFWVGEKGIYNVYTLQSTLINQDIIKTEKVDRSEDESTASASYTPEFIREFKGKTLSIDKSEAFIESIEGKCFQLKSIMGSTEIESNNSETLLKITSNNQILFTKNLMLSEELVVDEILSNSKLNPRASMSLTRINLSDPSKNMTVQQDILEYDKEKKLVLVGFNKNNLQFIRNVKISRPAFKNYLFDEITLANIPHAPSDELNAQEWYKEILIQGIENYFMNETDYITWATNKKAEIEKHYNVIQPSRKDIISKLDKEPNLFYKLAKLETIDYLNY
ncbi:MAG: hypothetical protein JNK50_04385 [Bacteroidia bacterium]|nr:hypothetical protein [Bacteroidia bacterium]